MTKVGKSDTKHYNYINKFKLTNMRNYQCKKCATLVQSNTQPASANCPSGSFHQWQNLGETGERNYQRKKCATVLKSKNQPASAGCPSGSFHQWSKL